MDKEKPCFRVMNKKDYIVSFCESPKFTKFYKYEENSPSLDLVITIP